MIDGLKPYPAMKDSRVPWLGQVPEHWEVMANRGLFLEVKDTGFPDEEMLSVTINQGVIRQALLLSETSKKDSSNEDKSKYKLVLPGDIAYNKMRAWQGAIGVSQFRGIVSPAYIVVRPRDSQSAAYFHYLFRIPAFLTEAQRWSYGISSDQWSLRPEHFKQIYCTLPPPAEQDAIVRFLDHADRLIRRYIGAKRKLIRLLEEQKQAIIHRAVTRGLDPNVRLKPSGVEWLGDVPAHWEVTPLKRLAWFKSGAGFPVGYQGEQGLEIPFLKVSDMTLPGNDTYVDNYKNTVSRETAAALGAYIFPENTIIFPKVGGAMLTNKRRMLRRPSCLDNNVMGCVADRNIVKYLFLLLQQLDLGKISKPGPVPAISEGEIREIRVAIPPEREQHEILGAVAADTADLNLAVAAARREIGLLQEYRTRLIADVVTGKLDVRAAAAALPEPQEAPDDLETEAEAPAEEELETAEEADVEEAAA